jgi:hypothetical protein
MVPQGRGNSLFYEPPFKDFSHTANNNFIAPAPRPKNEGKGNFVKGDGEFPPLKPANIAFGNRYGHGF